MVAVGREQFLQFSCPRPELCGHGYRLERVEASCHLLCALLVWGQANQLQDGQVADEHVAGGYLGVEPGCKLGEAVVACPSPYARVEQRRTIEPDWFDLSLVTQRIVPDG